MIRHLGKLQKSLLIKGHRAGDGWARMTNGSHNRSAKYGYWNASKRLEGEGLIERRRVHVQGSSGGHRVEIRLTELGRIVAKKYELRIGSFWRLAGELIEEHRAT